MIYDNPIFEDNSKIDSGYVNVYLDKFGNYVIGNVYGNKVQAEHFSRIVRNSFMYGNKPTLYRIKLTPKNIWDTNPLG